MDLQTFQANRQRFPSDQLERYRGQYVAWSPDGTTILDSDKSEFVLDRRLRSQGHDMTEVLISMVPSVDTILGGGIEE
ncbi:MAG TPA: hypothetical protein VGX78_22050 [Pirellulales bacterium]|nr:hypothetical protein [Pirellulales bacterium]